MCEVLRSYQKRGTEVRPKGVGKQPPAEGHMGRGEWAGRGAGIATAGTVAGHPGLLGHGDPEALQRSCSGEDCSCSIPPWLRLSAMGVGLCRDSPP